MSIKVSILLHDKKCDGKEIVCEKCNRKFFGKRCFENHLTNRSKVEGSSIEHGGTSTFFNFMALLAL